MGGIKRLAACVSAAAVGLAGLVSTAAPAGASGVTTLVSVDATGAPLHKTTSVAMSDDGSRVAFVANTDSQRNVLLRDRAAGTTTQVAFDAANSVRISGDGSVIAYRRLAEIRVYDVATAATSVVTANGSLGGVSSSGRFIVYTTSAGLFVYDRVAAASIALPPLDPALSPSSYAPGPVNDDGTVVAFSADVYVPSNGYRTRQAFVGHQATNSYTLVSVDEDGVAAKSFAVPSDMTPDGRFVALDTAAKLSSADPNVSRTDVYVRDLAAATTSFVGANFDDDDYPFSGESRGGALSDDGRFVAYVTDAQIAGKWDNDRDVVLADRMAGTLEVVSRAADGTPAGSVNEVPRMSGDGRFVAFASSAIDIVTPFNTDDCREEDWEDGMFTVNYGECSNAYVVDRAAVAGTVGSGGGTVSDSSTGTSVYVPPGYPGTVSIAPAPADSTVPDGYEVLGQQLSIEAPTATWSSPLRLTFTVDSAVAAAAGVTAADVAVIRDGVPIVDCAGATQALPPDTSSPDGYPCMTSRTTTVDGDIVLVVLTPHASVWAVAKVPPPADPEVTFASLCEASQAAAGQKGLGQSLCAKLSAASASRERGDGPSAARQLDAYRAHVAAQAGKALTVADADDLTAQSHLL